MENESFLDLKSFANHLFRSLRRHLWIAAAVFTSLFGIVAVATYFAPRTYISQAKLLVRLGRENVTLDPTTTLGQGPAVAIPISREQEMNSLVETILSRTMVEKLVDEFGPSVIRGREDWTPGATPTPADPVRRHKAIEQFLRNLDVQAPKKSTVIDISYRASSPELAQEIVRRLVDDFEIAHSLINRTPEAYEFLAEQVARSRNALERLQGEYREQKIKTGLFAADDQRSQTVARMGRIQDELLQTLVALRSAEGESTFLQAKLEKLESTRVLAQTKGFPNEATDRMREQMFALQVKEKELALRHPENHPERILIGKQLASIKELYDKESKSREQVTVSPSKVYEEAEVAQLRNATAVTGLKEKAAILEDQLRRETDRLKDLDQNALALSRLKQQIDLSESQYKRYAENLEQAQIDQALKTEKISNIRVIQPATLNPIAVSPKLLVNLGGGFLLAVAAAVGTALLLENRRPREPIVT